MTNHDIANNSVRLDKTPTFLPVTVVSDNDIFKVESDDVVIIGQGTIRKDYAPVSSENVLDVYQSSSDLDRFYSQLSGEFWLLIRDKQSQTQTLINDCFGIKSCYFSVQNDCLIVSDSLKAMKGVEKLSFSLSNQAIFNYFYFHCIPAPYTIYEECNKLVAGEGASIALNGEIEYRPVYKLEFATQVDDEQQLQANCMDCMENAVKQYDEEQIGAFLSGGLDSSTVAGMMAKNRNNAATFSIGFDAKEYDETEYAKITADHFSTDHKVLYLKPEPAVEVFVDVAQYFDEPFGNSSAMATYFCAKFAKENGINRLLAGDGGDELFAGNTRYTKQNVFEVFHQLPGAIQALPRIMFANELAGKIPLIKKVKSYIDQADIPLPGRLETYNFINQFGAANMFSNDFLKSVDLDVPETQQSKRYNECSSTNTVDRMLYLDWKFTLADNDIVKVKKMCELVGIDVAFPLLDKSLLEFSCKVPAQVKLADNNLRDFFKKSVTGFLAPETLTKSKHGFGLPFGVWMKENQQLKDLTMNCLKSFSQRNIIKQELIDNALEAHQSVHAGYYGELIWIMVILELWLQGEEND